MIRRSLAVLFAAAVVVSLSYLPASLGQTQDERAKLIESIERTAREGLQSGRITESKAREMQKEAEALRRATADRDGHEPHEGEADHEHAHEHHERSHAAHDREHKQEHIGSMNRREEERRRRESVLDRLLDAAAEARIRGDRRAIEEIERELHQHARAVIEDQITERVELTMRNRSERHPEHARDEPRRGELAEREEVHDDDMQRRREEAHGIERKVDAINREIEELHQALQNPAKRELAPRMEREIRELSELRERLVQELRHMGGAHHEDREIPGPMRELHEQIDLLHRRVNEFQGHTREMEHMIRKLQEQVRELARRER